MTKEAKIEILPTTKELAKKIISINKATQKGNNLGLKITVWFTFSVEVFSLKLNITHAISYSFSL